MKKALLIIDVQNDYFPNGKCPLYKPEAALNTIKDLLKKFRKQNLPVIYIRHESLHGTFFNPNTDGVQIHHDIKPLDTETVIVKHEPNSFYETDLQNKLVENEITELVVCGMMTHMCIDTTIRAAKDYGYEITLISDGCATKDLEWNGVTLPASLIQSTYMASLNQKFANIKLGAEIF
ncbi:cysteine hydrolase family protein [Hungatella sp.]|jgi:nicotinamidase-related amidase|uniref:cysteine hydrolase family protein n=1 Tax=Hungatella sp. TaxID=2613924 RepID=UPI002A808C27|nr:cysteine hydrolase family protein [Hungatella sp.]